MAGSEFGEFVFVAVLVVFAVFKEASHTQFRRLYISDGEFQRRALTALPRFGQSFHTGGGQGHLFQEILQGGGAFVPAELVEGFGYPCVQHAVVVQLLRLVARLAVAQFAHTAEHFWTDGFCLAVSQTVKGLIADIVLNVSL